MIIIPKKWKSKIYIEHVFMPLNMKLLKFIIVSLTFVIFACKSKDKEPNNSSIKIVGAMKNVMWKGDLENRINLDTVTNRNGLYGLGPASHLSGEILINNGKSFLSKVSSDSTMVVMEKFDISAPFFVYANVTEWDEIDLPPEINYIENLERFIIKNSTRFKKPFAFKLVGEIRKANIHIQNLPEGTQISSPKDAHTGQRNYKIENENVEIIGFFSKEHQGIFTHHDTYLHMHLMSKDESKMGHLDSLEIKQLRLFLPKK